MPLILIDEKTDRSAALGKYLTGNGSYRVIASSSPEVTISRCLSGKPGVLIVVQDEEQHGIIFLKNLREQKIDLPVIILANAYDTDIFHIAVANGAEYMVMAGETDKWYPVLEQLIAKVSANRRIQDKIAFFNKKLNLVGSVTRHDILNQLTAVSGYTELLEMTVEDPQMRLYIEKERFAIDKIRRLLQFSKDYQNMGTEPPVWQTISSVIRRAEDLISLKGISIKDTSGTASVLADPAVEKVVAQLLDNAIRHGQTVSSISISTHEETGGAVLVIEDNGVGVPDADKERIFERGFGKYTGWGLFLAREILAITDITITETGVPGKGACFEIHIPGVAYRKDGTGRSAVT
ncbi:hybrid sensor histidine kinase/response regulator [Methanoregula sp.]|jgi:signal transduction histidine kinase|uniref:hybrid sensor histidine kinase/response regulator n=1 Tax=Methanoregula sp. TaxID=2052170 RepID=UPI003C70F406